MYVGLGILMLAGGLLGWLYYVRRINRTLNEKNKLIDQLLNLSKLESGRLKLRAKEENIISLVNGYLQLFESLATQKKIELEFSANEKQIPAYIDRDKFEKILYNLLSNAFKFTGEGGEIVVLVGSWQSTVLS